MNHQQMVRPTLLAGAVLVIAGLPAVYLGLLVLIVGCPLLMYVMMRGMGHGEGRESHVHDQHATDSRDDEPLTPGR
jgi:hypothetical protein